MKTVTRVSEPRSATPVVVSWSARVLRRRDEALFGERLDELCTLFLRRIFGLSEVKSVKIDRREFTAEIRFDTNHSETTKNLQRLAGAIRGAKSQPAQAISECPQLKDFVRRSGRFKIWRLDTVSWMFVFWHHRYYGELKNARRRFWVKLPGNRSLLAWSGLGPPAQELMSRLRISHRAT